MGLVRLLAHAAMHVAAFIGRQAAAAGLLGCQELIQHAGLFQLLKPVKAADEAAIDDNLRQNQLAAEQLGDFFLQGRIGSDVDVFEFNALVLQERLRIVA